MSKTAILLVNLGSPDSTEPKDVKRYLDEFLMDKYVIDYPYIFRALLVKGIILNVRPTKSAAAYKKIWWEEGSPLIVLSTQLAEEVKKKVNAPVALGMRYGNPSIESAISSLLQEHKELTNLFVIPLYPQYAESTTRTVIEKTQEVIHKNNWPISVQFQEPFYSEISYINALAKSIEPYVSKYDHILFSYHGVPERHVKKTDSTKSHCLQQEDCCSSCTNPEAQSHCYRFHCFETTRAVVDKLKLEPGSYSISFQSRLGKDEWIKPYTDQRLEELPSQGIKKLAVACPAFVSDCLETLEEIGMEGKEEFLEAGGEEYIQIPCLNTNQEWVETLVQYSNNFLNTFEK